MTTGSRRTLSVAAVLTMVLVVLWPATARACSCEELTLDATLTEVGGEPDAVVVLGRVESVAAAPVPDDDEPREQGTTLTYSVAVERVWGGETTATTVVTASSDGDACGLDVPVGTEVAWRLYGGASGPWETGLCEQLPHAQLAAAPGGATPAPDPPPATTTPAESDVGSDGPDGPDGDPSADGIEPWLVGLAAGAAAALVIVRRSRRRAG